MERQRSKWLALLGVLVVAVPIVVVVAGLVFIRHQREVRKPDFDAIRCTALKFPDVQLYTRSDGCNMAAAASVTVDTKTGALVIVTLYGDWLTGEGQERRRISLEHAGWDGDCDLWRVREGWLTDGPGAKPALRAGDVIRYSGGRMLIYQEDDRQAYLLPAGEVEGMRAAAQKLDSSARPSPSNSP